MRKQLIAVLLVGVMTATYGATALAAPVYAQGTDSDFSLSVEETFREPEMQYRPYARWWLAEGSHTDETLIESIHELYDAGYGGIEFVTLNESQYLDDETYAWGSAEWIHDTHVIIEECAKLGMSVSMTSGTNWATANLMSIDPDMEAAAQELGYVTVTAEEKDENGLTRYRGELPVCSLPGKATSQRLVKVIAAKILARDEESVRLDMDSLTDVTDLAMDAGNDGIYWIEYTAPDDGEYELLAFYQYGTGETCAPAVSDSYTINYLDREGADALIAYWDEHVLTDEVQSLIDQIDECDMYMDSLECTVHGSNTTGNFWCADMLEQFEERRGYDLSTLLPLLVKGSTGGGFGGGSFGAALQYVYEPGEEDHEDYAENVRRDFYQTMTELYTENCLQVLSDWLHSKNMKLRAENSYGVTFEISQPIQALDYVETESMEFGNELDMYRGQAGAAHLFNKRYSSETGAWVSSNYRYSNEYYRQVFYMQYAAGIQKTVIHGYSSEYGPEGRVKWPGYEGMSDEWSERFNKRQPASLDYDALNLHFSRIQKALEQGVPKMDIAMLRTDYAYNNSVTPGGLMSFVENGVYSNYSHNQDAYYWRDLELQNAGYTYDYFSPWLLTAEGVDGSSGVLNADGAAYQALVVMQEELPFEAAEKMLEWAKNGLPILFVNNVEELVDNSGNPKINETAGSTTGTNDGQDEALAGLVSEMKALDNVKTVESEADAYEALQELGVYPRAQFVQSNTKLLPVLRSTEKADYLYLYHYMYEDEENYRGEISLDGSYGVYKLDTWSGEVTVCGSTLQDGRTVIHVDLAPGETAVYVLDKSQEAPSETGEAENTETEEITLSGWSLVVDSYEPGEKVTRSEVNEETGVETTEITYGTEHVEKDAGILEQLVSWKELEAVGETVSGTGTYTVEFTLPEEWDPTQSSAEFQAESFCGGTAAVWINGEQVPVNMDRGTSDLTAYAQPGVNTLTVRVTSSLRNVMIEQGYDSGWIFGAPDPDDYGMTGETKIVLYK